MGDRSYIQQFRMGEATVSILTSSYLQFPLANEMHTPWPDLSPEWLAICSKPSIIPAQCIHIHTPALSLLIDSGDSDGFIGTEYEQHEIPAPPTLIAQLAEIGVRADEITHVVFTHYHFDHISGSTILQDGAYVPAYPQAMYYLGKADWDSDSVQKSLQNPDSLISHTLGVLQQRKKLTLIENDLEINAQIHVLAAPGESPGHELIRLQAGGQVAYFIGDLYHHPVELAYPTWMVLRDDLEALKQSRNVFIARALQEKAFFVASHIYDIRRLLSPFVTESVDPATIIP
ncbi:MAG TPA: MBL fold metallo-hydrolase [Ktedonobacteraceae bacterium]|jgi:glyoxylase-like metal-dependent hydrolase (beta-lactamase superfamily II)|nr:MBL fold metallo-hydrolase [Ktedonobacteraceae bacterium]